MRKYTLRELKNMAANGMATDITSADYATLPKHLDCEGYSSGKYGVNGALLRDTATGEWYVITERSSILFRYL